MEAEDEKNSINFPLEENQELLVKTAAVLLKKEVIQGEALLALAEAVRPGNQTKERAEAAAQKEIAA